MTIIARDEADRIEDAIRSVSFATEVVVLDSGSSDDTVAVAKRMGARVIETDWPGHVAQKNRALNEAAHDWVLSIDADERVSKALAEVVREFMAQPEAMRPAGLSMPRLSWWMGAPVRHGTWHPDRRIRLVDRRRARWGGRNPHDVLEVDQPVAQGDRAIHARGSELGAPRLETSYVLCKDVKKIKKEKTKFSVNVDLGDLSFQ